MGEQDLVIGSSVNAALATSAIDVAPVTVCIATHGRPDVLSEALILLAKQTRLPQEVLICSTRAEDIALSDIENLPLGIRCFQGAAGLTGKRNLLLRALDRTQYILFIDDDFLLAADYIEQMVAKFEGDEDIVCLTGKVLADGASGAGLSVADGLAALSVYRPEPLPRAAPVFNAYGCNMAFRWSRLQDKGCWFDERLPLYGWAEDVDFSRQAAAYGKIIRFDAMVGVHLGAKHGRISGVRFGYSQVANQIYLAKKGTVEIRGALRKALENIAANFYGIIRQKEPFIDRKGRFKGNLLAVVDLALMKIDPERVLEIGRYPRLNPEVPKTDNAT